MDGYAGKILYANLTSGRLETRPFPDEWKRQYLGGRGIGIRILSDLVDPGTDPLSEKNVLIYATGPLTGTGMPLGSRYDVSAKSPLTGTCTSANSGGFFGPAMKRAGFDAIVFTGRARKPSYLTLDRGVAEIRDARRIWGRTITETTKAVQEELGAPETRVSCIGPAGEHLARIASIMNEGSRAAGRGGIIAVMGSKNIKAIAAVSGDNIGVENPDQVKKVAEQVRKKIAENPITGKGLHNYGTAVLVNIINENYILPTRNYQTAHFPEAEQISGEEISRTILKRGKGCMGCIVGCGREVQAEGKVREGPEYETTWASMTSPG
jgi:aldehyde:ferredoxin oxidoreductase